MLLVVTSGAANATLPFVSIPLRQPDSRKAVWEKTRFGWRFLCSPVVFVIPIRAAWIMISQKYINHAEWFVWLTKQITLNPAGSSRPMTTRMS